MTIRPDVWSNLFTSDPNVLGSARSYFAWAAPAYAIYGLGLCLFFASQGAGKVFWPVVAGSLRLAVIALGGWWLAASQAPAWAVFALIASGLAVFGIATGLSIYLVPWGKR